MRDVQHCRPCSTEYVAGVTACGECGGPLTPGPLPDPRANNLGQAPVEGSPVAMPDTKLIDLPGLQADFAVRALTLEGIVCGLECQGIRKLRLPESDPEEPLAVTLPVSIYVPSEKVSEAQSILRSLEAEDVIGGQWQPTPEGTPSDDPRLLSTTHDPAPTEDRQPAPFSTTDPPHSESTTLRLILFLAIAALIAYTLAR